MKRNNVRYSNNGSNNKPRPQRFGGGGGGHRRHGGGGTGQQPRAQAGVPDRRVLRRAQELKEKYYNQARDALASGDRVTAEFYFQHADHYYRVAKEIEEQIAEIDAARAAEVGYDNVVEIAEPLPEDAESQSRAPEAPRDSLPEEVVEEERPN